MFKVFKPQKRLKATDKYKTKPQLAIALLQIKIQNAKCKINKKHDFEF